MAKRVHSPAVTTETDNPVADSVDQLTAEVRVLRQVLDEIREDFSWAIRNGVPVKPVIHTRVKQMALDPCADDWGERLRLETSSLQLPDRQGLGIDSLDLIVESLTRSLESATHGQLDVVLSALETVRTEILRSLQKESRGDAAPTAAQSTSISTPKPPPGQLF